MSSDYAFGRYRIDSVERILRFEGRRVALAPKVVDTLLVFLAEPDRMLAKAELMDRIWPDGFVEEANLTQNIYILRRMFADHGCGARIENVPKRGYRFIAPAVEHNVKKVIQPSLARRFLPAASLACVLLLGIGGPLATPQTSPVSNPYQLPPADLQRYELGRYFLNRGTPPDLRRSVALFTQLADHRPRSALGFAGLADGFTSMTFGVADPVERARLGSRAIAFANRAVSLEADSADANAALGAVETSIEHDDVAAARSFEVALRIAPHNLDALEWYGTACMDDGKITKARQLFERAVSVEPHSPGAIASLAWADFLAGDFSESAVFASQLLRSHRLESIARITLASDYVEMRDDTNASVQIHELRRDPDMRIQAGALLSEMYALRGAVRSARRELARLEGSLDPDRVGEWDVLALAAAYVRSGQRATAFAWLARVRPFQRGQLARDRRFESIKHDRRFNAWLTG